MTLTKFLEELQFGKDFLLNQGILYVNGWCTSLALLSKNFVVNYNLVVSYPQQCHIGINVDH